MAAYKQQKCPPKEMVTSPQLCCTSLILALMITEGSKQKR